MPAAVAVFEGPAHIFRFHNDQYRRLVHASDTLVGLTAAAALPGPAGEEITRRLDEVYRTGHPYVGTEVEITLPGFEAEGTRFVNVAYVTRRDAAGEIDGVIVHAVDVTELVRARRQGLDLVSRLGVERERLHQVLEQMEAGVVISDADGRLLFANRTWRETFDVPPTSITDIESYVVFVGFHPDGRRYEPSEYPLARALQTGEQVTRERIRFKTPDGRERILDVSASRLAGLTSDPAQAMATTIDMTEQLRLQQELASQQEQELLRRAEFERRRAYEVNDTVLQRLAVADLAFDLDQTDEARAALREALSITKRLISEWGTRADDLTLTASMSGGEDD